MVYWCFFGINPSNHCDIGDRIGHEIHSIQKSGLWDGVLWSVCLAIPQWDFAFFVSFVLLCAGIVGTHHIADVLCILDMDSFDLQSYRVVIMLSCSFHKLASISGFIAL